LLPLAPLGPRALKGVGNRRIPMWGGRAQCCVRVCECAMIVRRMETANISLRLVRSLDRWLALGLRIGQGGGLDFRHVMQRPNRPKGIATLTPLMSEDQFVIAPRER
jgi:hypothetical protein